MQAPELPRRVTLADVAARAKVDRSVVSRVVNGDPRLSISDATRRRVAKAIEDLGYRPNVLARSLRMARAGALGLVIPDFANPIYASIIKGAEAEAARHDCLLVAASATTSTASRDPLDLLVNGRVDGMLFAGSRPDGSPWSGLDDMFLPWLLLNQRSRGASRYVVLDDERAAEMAVGHLVELGHRRIAHVAGQANVDTAKRRRAGYMKAMAKARLTVHPGQVVEAVQSSEGGMAAMAKILQNGPRPTAVFVSNVAAAVGVLECLREAKLDVPGQMSVAAVHDPPMAAHLYPSLTTVRMPLEELGRRGVELLLESQPKKPIREILDAPMELMARGSTGPAPAA